ncbi:MAG: hypothetical protein H3C30_04150 [Candidatus Hydrogenedentes bacterium]|nr:hypothetical protein [Candidatus Hydrogenedentota bacterium]
MRTHREFSGALADWREGGGAMCHAGAVLPGEAPVWQVGTAEEVAEVSTCSARDATVAALAAGGLGGEKIAEAMADWREVAPADAGGGRLAFPLILVEVPHQARARAYAVFDRGQFETTCEANVGNAHIWPDNPTEGDYLAAFGNDLHHYEVIESAEEAHARIATPREVHQDLRVRLEVGRACMDTGWLQHEVELHGADKADPVAIPPGLVAVWAPRRAYAGPAERVAAEMRADGWAVNDARLRYCALLAALAEDRPVRMLGLARGAVRECWEEVADPGDVAVLYEAGDYEGDAANVYDEESLRGPGGMFPGWKGEIARFTVD